MSAKLETIGRDTLLAEGVQLVSAAAAAGLTVRLIGGVAIYARATDAARRWLARDYVDLDVVAHRAEARRLREWLEQRGYRPDAPFNAAHGAERLMYFAPDARFHVDVFLDRFRMSHSLDFRDRLGVEPVTIPAADLLLTKLQIAELNLKDAGDTAMLLLDHEPAGEDGPGRLALPRVVAVTAGDWGFCTTFTDNVGHVRDRLAELLPAAGPRRVVAQRLDVIERAVADAPKTRAWRLRAKVGRRVRWYELPDESVDEN
jgi:hypothetical protein